MIEIAPAGEDFAPLSRNAIVREARDFVPRPIETSDAEPDPAGFARLAAAAAAATGALARTACSGAVAGWRRPEWVDCDATAAGDALAEMLVVVRFGGGFGEPPMPGGSAVRRMRARLAAMFDQLAATHWPQGERAAGIELSLTLAGGGQVVWIAVPAAAPGSTARPPTLAPAAMELPFRVPVAVSSEMTDLARLLPFVAGAIWPISPQPLVPLHIAGRRVATARIEPTPDGRQQAVIVERAQL